MLRTLYSTRNIKASNPIQYSSNAYSTLKGFKYKKKYKEHANDGSGKHPHVARVSCKEPNCEDKKCTTLCSNETKTDMLGHLTHRPTTRIIRHVAATDANGKVSSQYFCKYNKPKVLTPEEVTEQVKEEPKVTAYVNQPEISSKINND